MNPVFESGGFSTFSCCLHIRSIPGSQTGDRYSRKSCFVLNMFCIYDHVARVVYLDQQIDFRSSVFPASYYIESGYTESGEDGIGRRGLHRVIVTGRQGIGTPPLFAKGKPVINTFDHFVQRIRNLILTLIGSGDKIPPRSHGFLSSAVNSPPLFLYPIALSHATFCTIRDHRPGIRDRLV